MTPSRIRLVLLGWLAALFVMVFASGQAIVDPLGRATPAEIALVFGFDQVDLGGLTEDLAGTVDQALRPARSSLWLRAR